MRLVDFFVDTLLFSRDMVSTAEQLQPEYDSVRATVERLFRESEVSAMEAGYALDVFEQAKFGVAAFIDELMLTSKWDGKSQWQQLPLQRLYFDTTNAGAEFYDRLNRLQKHGDDRNAREVYLLCLGLGFKGRYYDPEDRPRLEEARGFNLSLLLPKESNQNFEKLVLFSSAYNEQQLQERERKTRLNITPMIIGVSVVLVLGFFLFYASHISSSLNDIVSLVK